MIWSVLYALLKKNVNILSSHSLGASMYTKPEFVAEKGINPGIRNLLYPVFRQNIVMSFV